MYGVNVLLYGAWLGMKMTKWRIWRMCNMEVKKWRMKRVITLMMLIFGNRFCKSMHILIPYVSHVVDVIILFLRNTIIPNFDTNIIVNN